jgi:hypothetical protein
MEITLIYYLFLCGKVIGLGQEKVWVRNRFYFRKFIRLRVLETDYLESSLFHAQTVFIRDVTGST